MSHLPVETVHSYSSRCDDLGTAESLAASALAHLRAGRSVELRFAARSMAPGFAARLVRLLAVNETWPSRATVAFKGDPDVTAVLRRAIENDPDVLSHLYREMYGCGAPGPEERTPRKRPNEGGS